MIDRSFYVYETENVTKEEFEQRFIKFQVLELALGLQGTVVTQSCDSNIIFFTSDIITHYIFLLDRERTAVT